MFQDYLDFHFYNSSYLKLFPSFTGVHAVSMLVLFRKCISFLNGPARALEAPLTKRWVESYKNAHKR
jgi:hypothetical protein